MLNPNSHEALANKGYSLNQINDFIGALDCWNKAIRIKPNEADYYLNKGFTLKHLNNETESLQCFNKACELNPRNHIAFLNKGVALFMKKDFLAAIETFDKSIQISPNFDNISNKAFALMSLKEYKEALVLLENALEIKPLDIKVISHKGQALIHLKGFKIFLKFLQKYFYYFSLLKFLPDYEAAIECFNAGINLGPFDPELYINKGFALRELLRDSEAIKEFNHAILLNPFNDSYYYQKVIKLN